MSVEDRFWKKVEKTDGCWIWKGAIRGKGYGCLRVGTCDSFAAHRFSYQLAYGSIPIGMLVCHKCDNRVCVNPSHLFIGTNRDNMIDASRKGRLSKGHLSGEKNGKAKLTVKDVEIIKSLKGTMSQSKIAAKFGVSQTAIGKILRGESWAEAPARIGC